MPEIRLNEVTSQLLTFSLLVSPFVLLISSCLFQKFSFNMKTLTIFWSLHNSPTSQTSFLNPTLTFILTSLAGPLKYSAGHLILIRSVCVCFAFFFFSTEINISELTFKMSWTTQQIVFIIPKQNTELSPFWLCALFYYLLWFYTVRNT